MEGQGPRLCPGKFESEDQEMETTRMKTFVKVVIVVGVLTGLAMYIGGILAIWRFVLLGV